MDLFRYILIPFSSGVTLLNFVTQTAAVIRVFAVIQLLTNGGPNHGTTTMMYLIYQEGLPMETSGRPARWVSFIPVFRIARAGTVPGDPQTGWIGRTACTAYIEA